MSYIVKALRKLEQERRRVTVTEMTLFRGLSERWQCEKPVWRYLLVLSLVVNSGLAVCILLFFGHDGRGAGKANRPLDEASLLPINKASVRQYPNSLMLDAPLKISLEVRPSQRLRTQPRGRDLELRREMPVATVLRSTARDDRKARREVVQLPQEPLSVDEPHISEDDAPSVPKVLIWKDENGNLHYSGVAGGR